MFTIATYYIKFKTTQEKLENIFLHYDMRKVQENTFIADDIRLINFKKKI